VSDSNLVTAKYLAHTDEAGGATTAVESNAALPVAPPSSILPRIMSRLSLVVGAAVLICITILAIGLVKSTRDRVSARAKKATSPIDWMLWFGGAKEDQTFDKFIQDSAERSQREWDERYRESPVYKLGPNGIDWSDVQKKLGAGS
jgi:hypothetical protein